MELQEANRIERLYADNQDIHRAHMSAIAFHEPGKLSDLDYEWKKRAGIIDVVSALEKAQQMVKELHQANLKVEG